MVGVAASTLHTAEAMQAQLIHLCMTMLAMLAMVWPTDGNTQAESCGCSNDIIIHPKPNNRDGEGMQPCPRLLGHHR